MEGLEECDDGNQIDNDSCPNYCRLPVCGNDVKEGNEICDDGNTDNGDGCDENCKKESVCGDGKKEDDEECDNGEKNSDQVANACRNDCRFAYCGDGVLDVGEDCDGGDNCTQVCTKIGMLQRKEAPFVFAIMTVLLSGGGLLFFLRRRIGDGGTDRGSANESISLDDIPLDELEMPWHKWGGDKR
jgi:cysteine-rich repeat protein